MRGSILERVYLPHEVGVGPDETLTVLGAEFDKILKNHEPCDVHVWAIGRPNAALLVAAGLRHD